MKEFLYQDLFFLTWWLHFSEISHFFIILKLIHKPLPIIYILKTVIVIKLKGHVSNSLICAAGLLTVTLISYFQISGTDSLDSIHPLRLFFPPAVSQISAEGKNSQRYDEQRKICEQSVCVGRLVSQRWIIIRQKHIGR